MTRSEPRDLEFEGAARALLAERYGIVGRLSPLPGERDQNFRVQTPDGGPLGVLKFSTDPRRALEFEAALLAHLAPREGQLGCHIPRLLPTLDGALLCDLPRENGAARTARLVAWVPGTPFADARPRPLRLLEDLGTKLGRLDAALADFEHPDAARVAFEWDLTQGLEVIARELSAVSNSGQRRSLAALLITLRRRLEPHLGELRRGVIHNDANDHNVLVTLGLDGRAEVTGLIDFGDTTHTFVAAEPAIAGAYALLGRGAPLEALAAVVRGYHREHPLTEVELVSLFDLTRLRLGVSVALAARNMRRAPHDTYLQISAEPAWRALERLERIPKALAEATLRQAAGLDGAPRMSRVLAWLAASESAYRSVEKEHPPRAPMFEGDLELAPRVDLSVASPLVVGPEGELDVPGWGARVRELVQHSPSGLALGFHGEARLVYATPAFDGAPDDGPQGALVERRTVHLGADVFGAAGTAVHTPIAGEVVSVVDHTAPLDYGPTVILLHTPAEGVAWYTLFGHLDREVITRLAPGAQLAAGALVGRLGPPDHNGGWTPHLHVQLLDPGLAEDLAARGDAPGVAAPRERDAWSALCPDPAPLLGVSSTAAARTELRALVEARAQRLGRSLSVSYRRPLHIVKGRGRHLFDSSGRRYLDCVNNVAHVGHCHPHVVRAGAAQMAVLNTNTRYLHERILRYTERLLATLPPHLEVMYLVNSGSEANELALRLAEAATGARDVFVHEAGYHGNTRRLIELSHYKFAGKGGAPQAPHVHVVPLPDPERGLHRGPDSGPRYVAEVETRLADLAKLGRGIAAFLAEPLIGCGGQIVPPAGYLSGAFDAVRRAGGVAIADEVQVGFGRVGTHFWAFQADGAVPDIVTMGKPIGNGHPLGAVATTRAVADAFANGMEFFNTFGGNPVSAAIGEAVLDVVEGEGLLANARHVSARFFERARDLHAYWHDREGSRLGSIRGRGLYLGIELVQDEASGAPATAAAAYIAERLRELGILISTDGPHANVLKIKPPLVITIEDIDLVFDRLSAVLHESALR